MNFFSVVQLEDDVRIVNSSFVHLVYSWSRRMGNLSMVRYGRWGEAYLTSLVGAKNILERICYRGLRANIDTAFRELIRSNETVYEPCTLSSNHDAQFVPSLQLTTLTNRGFIHKTKHFTAGAARHLIYRKTNRTRCVAMSSSSEVPGSR
jgi:hypothetical protein